MTREPVPARFLTALCDLAVFVLRPFRLRATTLSVLSTLQYDAVPIQSSVVLCSCSSPSMVRNQVDSSLQPVAAACGSRQELNMESTLQQPPQPRKKRPEDFKFGKILGEGSFSTVSICGSCLPLYPEC